MDLHLIELAAQKFFEMCKKHPEICPHDWTEEWCEKIEGEEDTMNVHFKCRFCGSEKIEEKPKDRWLW